MFSYWDQIKDKPKELSSYLKEKENNPDAVQYFLSLKDVKGRNVISHLATVQRGEFMPGFIDNLVKMGVSPDQYDHDGRSPLYWAVNDGCLANTIQLMVSLKGNSICTTEQLTTMINKPNIRGMPPIGKAIFHGHIEIVSFLLKQKARLGWQDNNGHTPLILACMSGNKAVVNLILSKLEDNQQINQPDKIGLTPLHYAFEKNPDLAPALLARGADLSIKGGENFNTPLITACQKWSDLEQVFNAVSEDNHLEKALHLFNIEGWWPLGVACAENKPALVQQLLKSGSGLETCNLQGNALQIACKAGNLDCLNALLWFIHDPDSLVSLFVTKPLLHLVIDSGSTETPAMINALLLSGSDPLKTDKEGNMAFHHAIINKSEAAFIALIDNEQVKRGINHINTFGETPLHLVSHAGSQDAITRLIKAGADISIRDLDGNTIIHQCAAKGYTDCLELLLMPSEIPAREIVRRLSCKNRLGYTPVDLASVSNSHEAKRFIETVLKKCV